jgi:TorA maturation chaperone TorD
MAIPTIQNVFGDGSSQDANSLTILKSDLQAVGLTVSSNNTATSLLIALMLKAAVWLNETKQESDPDINVVITRGLDNLTTRNNTNYRQYSYTLEAQVPDVSSSIDPDDF